MPDAGKIAEVLPEPARPDPTQADPALSGRWREVLERLAEAARASGRTPGDVRLVAVSKLHPADAVRELAALGQRDFGENYVQEALGKMETLALPCPDLRWHFIGHLQTNKVKYVAGRFSLIHTLDSDRLARALHERSLKLGRTQDVLIQVNLGGEEAKTGVSREELPGLAESLAGLSALRLEGLMLLPPFFDDPEAARPYFRELRQLRDDLEVRLGMSLPVLSMGMSGDFEAAIAEGATHVRVGTSIFGHRACPKAVRPG